MLVLTLDRVTSNYQRPVSATFSVAPTDYQVLCLALNRDTEQVRACEMFLPDISEVAFGSTKQVDAPFYRAEMVSRSTLSLRLVAEPVALLFLPAGLLRKFFMEAILVADDNPIWDN